MEFNWGLMFSSYATVFTPGVLFIICVGVTAGIVIGSLPGLTATMGVALLVPLTFGRPPLESLSMLIGIYCGAMYGGSISAILIRTPGTPAAAATILEGYPMARRGEAGRAMSMALFASFFGGIVGALIMTFASPVVSGFALEFGPVEYFALAIFGLSVIVSISGRSLIKGMMAAFFGLLLIGGWVAMWRPMEVFLYDWWPMAAELRLLRRLARITVQVLHRPLRLGHSEPRNTPD